MRLLLGCLWTSLLCAALAGPAWAQVGERPGDRRPEPGSFADDDRIPALELPSLPLDPPVHGPRSGVQLVVAEFRFRGNTVFSDEALSATTSRWVGIPIGPEDLYDVTDAVTRLYIDAGYVSSGAIIPDQDSDDGTVLVEIIEGRVVQIDVAGTRGFRPGYIRKRLELSGSPLNVFALEEKLQLLQQDPQIGRIDARLTPAIRRGESVLSVDVEEERPFDMSIHYSNRQSPSIGANSADVLLSQRNLLGIGDLLSASARASAGFRSAEINYALPLNSRDTLLRLGFRISESEVVEDPFAILDINGELTTYRVALEHPLYKTPHTRLLLGVAFEYRRSKTTFLGGDPLFEVPGSDALGNVKVQLLRFSSDWVWRTRSQVVAIRAVASVGLDTLDPRIHTAGTPDGRFFALLTQGQWVYQLSGRYLDTQVVARSDLQLASDSLVSIERFAVGGRNSVRGYRENTLVRDNGWVSSLELRVPLDLGLPSPSRLELAPFVDVGMSWNHSGETSQKTLASIGLGLRYAWADLLYAELYWGGKLSSTKRSAPGLQGHGLHIQVSCSLP